MGKTEHFPTKTGIQSILAIAGLKVKSLIHYSGKEE